MRSYTVASIWDIPIRVNTSLLVFLPILAWLIGAGGQIEVYAGFIGAVTGVGFDLGVLRAGLTPWTIGVAAAVGLFVSVTLHELGHSWVALRYDIGIESITLWILGGIAALESLPKEWNREFWIAIAGPVASVAVAVACYAATLAIPAALQVPRFVAGWLAVTNLVLAGFNLLPAFPMDGGRILRALLARSRPYGTATRIAGRVGVVFAFLFAVVGVLTFQLLLLLLALFIYGAATTESRTVLLDELLEGITVGDIMTRDPATLDPDTTLDELGDRMLRDRRTTYLVTGDGEPPGIVTLDDLKRSKGSDRASTTVRSVARELPTVDAGADAFDTLAMLQGSGSADALVEQNGVPVGLLTEADYSRAMTVRRGFQSGIGG
jgi:Zn-dependent protease